MYGNLPVSAQRTTVLEETWKRSATSDTVKYARLGLPGLVGG